MNIERLKPGARVRGPLFPEPVQIISCTPMGQSVKLIGKPIIKVEHYACDPKSILAAEEKSL